MRTYSKYSPVDLRLFQTAVSHANQRNKISQTKRSPRFQQNKLLNEKNMAYHSGSINKSPTKINFTYNQTVQPQHQKRGNSCTRNLNKQDQAKHSKKVFLNIVSKNISSQFSKNPTTQFSSIRHQNIVNFTEVNQSRNRNIYNTHEKPQVSFLETMICKEQKTNQQSIEGKSFQQLFNSKLKRSKSRSGLSSQKNGLKESHVKLVYSCRKNCEKQIQLKNVNQKQKHSDKNAQIDQFKEKNKNKNIKDKKQMQKQTQYKFKENEQNQQNEDIHLSWNDTIKFNNGLSVSNQDKYEQNNRLTTITTNTQNQKTIKNEKIFKNLCQTSQNNIKTCANGNKQLEIQNSEKVSQFVITREQHEDNLIEFAQADEHSDIEQEKGDNNIENNKINSNIEGNQGNQIEENKVSIIQKCQNPGIQAHQINSIQTNSDIEIKGHQNNCLQINQNHSRIYQAKFQINPIKSNITNQHQTQTQIISLHQSSVQNQKQDKNVNQYKNKCLSQQSIIFVQNCPNAKNIPVFQIKLSDLVHQQGKLLHSNQNSITYYPKSQKVSSKQENFIIAKFNYSQIQNNISTLAQNVSHLSSTIEDLCHRKSQLIKQFQPIKQSRPIAQSQSIKMSESKDQSQPIKQAQSIKQSNKQSNFQDKLQSIQNQNRKIQPSISSKVVNLRINQLKKQYHQNKALSNNYHVKQNQQNSNMLGSLQVVEVNHRLFCMDQSLANDMTNLQNRQIYESTQLNNERHQYKCYNQTLFQQSQQEIQKWRNQPAQQQDRSQKQQFEQQKPEYKQSKKKILRQKKQEKQEKQEKQKNTKRLEEQKYEMSHDYLKTSVNGSEEKFQYFYSNSLNQNQNQHLERQNFKKYIPKEKVLLNEPFNSLNREIQVQSPFKKNIKIMNRNQNSEERYKSKLIDQNQKKYHTANQKKYESSSPQKKLNYQLYKSYKNRQYSKKQAKYILDEKNGIILDLPFMENMNKKQVQNKKFIETQKLPKFIKSKIYYLKV